MPDEEVDNPAEETEETVDEETTEEEKVGDTEDTEDVKEDLTDDERKELDALRKKEMNFKKLREQSKKTKKQVDERVKELEDREKDFRENMIKERKEDALALLVEDDKELRKKVLLNYDRIIGDAVTKEEVYAKMRDAVNMLGGNVAPNPLARQYRGGNDRFDQGKRGESSEAKELREALNISDADKKKYGKEDWKPKI